jgi:acylphosphatase
VIRRRIVVHGKVQGVFFRETARWAAEQHGVSGWVRNNDDGTVEAVFEGNDEAVAESAAVFEEGPPDADVERAEVFEEEPEKLRGFKVVM